jgi:2-methylcitrate dehydratase PrpD
MDHVGKLAAFCAEATAEQIGPEALGRAALVLADCLGAIVGGAAEPDVAALRARPYQAPPGPAAMIGTTAATTPAAAAFLNGTAGTALEMDEGNQFAKGHPGIHVVPAALAAAAAQGGVSGRDLLAAIALGYEVAARVGIATVLNPALHPHGTWGAVGAAVAVLHLSGADAATMREGINMAASLGLANSRRTMLEGGTVRNAYTGLSGQMGIYVADMLAAGFCADTEGLVHVYSRVAGSAFTPEALTEDLGTRWEVARNYFKMHSCCRYNHAALDALDRILATQPVDAAAVTAIEVDTYGLAVELDDPAPRNVLGAKFSVPFAVATRLVTGSSGVESFATNRVADPAIRAFAARVTLREDPELSAALPARRPARVALHLADGTVLRGETASNRGDWADPYPLAEVREKYLSLARRLWDEDRAAAIWDQTLALADGQTDDLLAALLAAPRT